MTTIKDRLGSDLKFPINGNFEPVSQLDTLIQDIQQLLLTAPGERLYRPEYGCEIVNMLWENIDKVEQAGKEAIKSSLKLFEPRITVTDVVSQINRDTGLIIFGIKFIINNTDTSVNLIFPLRTSSAISNA
jgi:phage baseplate assembly protein W